MQKIKVSSKCVLLKFICVKPYILSKCKGKCCRINCVPLLNDEIDKIKKLAEEKKVDVTIDGNFMRNQKGESCKFQNAEGLCSIDDVKPFACRVSPFRLTPKNTLTVKRRNLSLGCFKDGKMEAYKVFRKSLELLGADNYKKIARHIRRNPKTDLVIDVDDVVYNKFTESEVLKKSLRTDVK